MKKLVLSLLLVLLVSATLAAQPTVSQRSTVIDLGTLGGISGSAFAINNQGHVVGYSQTATFDMHAFFWTEELGMIDLGTLGGSTSYARVINDRGQVAGESLVATHETHAFLWSEESGMMDLGTLGGHRSGASDINESGQVVGGSTTATGDRHAFLWSEESGMMDLGTLGGLISSARAINESGQVVGISITATGETHAFLWTEDLGMIDLGTLGGPYSQPGAINDRGQVVGYSETTTGAENIFLWTQELGMRDLGLLGGAEGSAKDINERGQVVGISETASGAFHAFLWTEELGMIDLGTLGGSESAAYDVNEHGQAVGSSRIATFGTHAALFSLTPIYVSSSSSGTVGGVDFKDEDILAYDPGSGTWSKFFDGSDVDAGGEDLNGFLLLDDGSILMTFDDPFDLNGVGEIDDSDIVRFFPTSTGSNTAGSFSLFFDGSDVGLTRSGEDVDSIGVTPDGRLVISTSDDFSADGVSGRDEDLFVFNATSFGENTSGSFEQYFDGSDVDLRSTDLEGTWIDGGTGAVYLTVNEDFSVPGVSGDRSDIFICDPGSLGSSTSCTFNPFWDGSANDFGDEKTDGISIGDRASIDDPGAGPQVDLVVTKTESADPVVAGSGPGNLTYVVNVANRGPSNATGVSLSEVLSLPSGVSVDSITPSQGTFSGSTWTVGSLANGASATLTVVLTVSDPGPYPGPGSDVVSDTATVISANETLINTGDDSATESTAIVTAAGPEIDLVVSKTESVDPVVAGSGPGNLIYVVTVANRGPADATGVVLNEVLSFPGNVSVDSITPSQGTFSGSTWSVGSLANGSSATLTVVLTVASASGPYPGPYPGPDPNVVSDTATVIAANETRINTGDDSATESTSITTASGGGDEILFVSSSSSGTAGGVDFKDEDILAFDTTTGAWSMVFDGSDVDAGSEDLTGFALPGDGSVLMSFDDPFDLNGVGEIDDSDIVRFFPTATGADTAGTFELYFDGSDVGLDSSDEDIDAIHLLANGDLVLSTTGSFSVDGVSGKDEDLIRFTPTSLGANTSGTWSLYFDGSDVDMTSSDEDVRGTWIDEKTGEVYLTTKDDFSVNGLIGDRSDIFICKPGSLGGDTSCTFSLFWDGSANGFDGERTDGIAIKTLPPCLGTTCQAWLSASPAVRTLGITAGVLGIGLMLGLAMVSSRPAPSRRRDTP